jgi:hypothetical protein|tara:strand:+ start:3159 stop:3824 length:666 start_codon:yes stop_codon:yes gene_type:complete
MSKQTLDLLKNFASINSNILVKPGDTIKTISPVKNIMAVATVPETFDTEFGIWDLNKFLGTVSLFDSPSFEFGERSVTISGSGGSSVNYYYSEPRLLTVPTKDIVMPDPVVSFNLTQDALNEINRASSVMQLPDLVVRSEGTTIVMVALDRQDDTTNSYSVELGELSVESDFEFVFRVENLKLLPGDYRVDVTDKVVSQFTHTQLDLKYWIALESDSRYSA